MIKRFVPVLLVAALAVPATAQDDPAPKPADTENVDDVSDREGVDEATDAETEAKPEVAAIKGVRYRVFLKTGREIEGVVRSAGVFERATRGGYIDCDQEHELAGIRVWYPGKQDGFVFVRLEEIARLLANLARKHNRADALTHSRSCG